MNKIFLFFYKICILQNVEKGPYMPTENIFLTMKIKKFDKMNYFFYFKLFVDL